MKNKLACRKVPDVATLLRQTVESSCTAGVLSASEGPDARGRGVTFFEKNTWAVIEQSATALELLAELGACADHFATCRNSLLACNITNKFVY